MEKVAVVRTRMSVPPPLPPKTTRRSVSGTGVVGISVSERPVSLDCHQTPPSAGATVFIANKDCSAGLQDIHSFPEVKIRNGHNSDISAKNSVLHSGHIVTIKINPEINRIEDRGKSVSTIDFNLEPVTKTTVDVDEQQKSGADGCIRISVNNSDTIDELNQRNDNMMKNSTMQESFVKTDRSNGSYFYYGPFPCSPTVVMSSGQCSPSDTLDSGTCSDLDSTPPPLPKKKNPKSNGVSVTVIAGQHNRASSITSSGAEVDSDDNESNISYDSLNSSELNNCESKAIKVPNNNKNESEKPPSPPVLPVFEPSKVKTNNGLLPRGLLQDIRDRSVKLSVVTVTPKTDQKPVEPVKFSSETRVANVSNTVAKNCNNKKLIVIESTYEERTLQKQKKQDQVENVSNRNFMYDTDKFYTFHLNENVIDDNGSVTSESRLSDDEETFAGYKDLLGKDVSATIRSAKGTVRGVKNRVRAGIATFLQMHNTTKSYHDTGKVVVYSTTMGTVRETYQQCLKVKQILRTLLIKFEERDMFMSSEYQAEIRERMRCDEILVPQVFVDGQHIGDAETVERLNESGELRRILKPYKSLDACTTCKMCGGYRLLPCPVCNGSKKSVHRNHFTTEFVALKCMNCDEVGLVRCHAC